MSESDSEIPRFKKGAVVLVPFPFTDLSAEKVRPAVILAESGDEDVLVAFITSNMEYKNEFAVTVERETDEFSATGLKTESLIRVDKIATLEKNIVLGEIGCLPDTLKKEVDEVLEELFSL